MEYLKIESSLHKKCKTHTMRAKHKPFNISGRALISGFNRLKKKKQVLLDNCHFDRTFP